MLEQAFALFRAGRLEEARRVAQALPQDASVLHLLGMIAYREEHDGEARELLERARALAPANVHIALMLGHAQRRLGALAAARSEYRRAQTLDLESVEPPFYLGALARDGGEPLGAAECFLWSALLEPGKREPYQRLLDSLKEAMRAGVAPRDNDDAPLPLADSSTFISFVVCSIDAAKFSKVSSEIGRAMGTTPHEIIGIHDARSLCEGYNRGARQARGDYLVFCHDDIEILDPRFRARLTHYLAQLDVVGVAGTERLVGPAWSWSGPPQVHGWVAQMIDGEEPIALCAFGLSPSIASRIEALDGVFIATRRDAFEAVRFDDARFDGFHFYDLDFSYRAHRAGLKLGVVRDMLLLHYSGGKESPAWQRYAQVFLMKFPEVASQAAKDRRHFFPVALRSREELIRYCGALRALLARGDTLLAKAGLPSEDPRRVRARALA